jgi:hypothetical protein
MVLEQTINIPADRRVFFEFLAPRELPPGPARVELKVTPVDEERRGTEANAEEQAVKLTPALKKQFAAIRASMGDMTIEQIYEERRQKDAGEYTGESATPHLDALAGILAGAGDITLEQIREERRRKYDVENTAKSATPITDRLSGVAAHLGDITLEQIREERLSKYL